jgi:hypothetical protein
VADNSENKIPSTSFIHTTAKNRNIFAINTHTHNKMPESMEEKFRTAYARLHGKMGEK